MIRYEDLLDSNIKTNILKLNFLFEKFKFMTAYMHIHQNYENNVLVFFKI